MRMGKEIEHRGEIAGRENRTYAPPKYFPKAKVSQLVVQESEQMRRRMQERALQNQARCAPLFAVPTARPPSQKHRVALLRSPLPA